MGHFIDDKKHIENDDNKNDKNKVKINSYDRIKDIVLGKNEKLILEKNNKNNKNNTIKKATVDIGL
jgi:hypothetical protein